MDAKKLEALEGRSVRMYLDDGEVSDVRLLAVDADDHLDLVYDMIQVVVPGSGTDYPPGPCFRIPIANVVRVEPVEPS